MNGWAGLALALRSADRDGMRSRLPTYIHPLAGRSLAWHVLRAMAAVEPAPRRLFLAATRPLDPSILGELSVEIIDAVAEPWWTSIAGRLAPATDRLLVVDAAAAALSRSLAGLVAGPPNRVLVGTDGRPLAAWLERGEAETRGAGASTLEEMALGLAAAAPEDPGEAFIVHDRAQLARAGSIIRDRLVRRLMDGGVTFLLPETVLVDVDVEIGADAVIYPGVILEGTTTIGAETVIGPGCRIIDSWIGSGAELKGWNYVSGARVHNRAVLEPYVRRGFD